MMVRKVLPLVLFASACATQSAGWSRVSVRLSSLQAGSRDSSGIKPVADAAVSLQCPNKPAVELGRTDADGSLRASPDVDVPLTCDVAVTRQGFKPATFKVANLCSEQGSGVCRSLDLNTVLSADATHAAR